MITRNSIQLRIILLISIGVCISFQTRSQILTFDTLKSDSAYVKYIVLSKQILSSIKKSEDQVIDKYLEHPGLYKKADLNTTFPGYTKYYNIITTYHWSQWYWNITIFLLQIVSFVILF